jgi:hypothetical protein
LIVGPLSCPANSGHNRRRIVLWSVLAGAQACDLLLQNAYRLWWGLF